MENIDNEKNVKYNIFGIKNKYILKKIFKNLHERKLLVIIQYNNYLKNLLNININNYKKVSELYSSIILEITPIKNEYGKFIREEGHQYFHIYFDDNKEEIKRNYLIHGNNVTKIKIIIDYQIISFRALFKECILIESIKFIKFYRTNIKDMGHMFNGCILLKQINFSNFKTNNVTNMNSMFQGCLSLEELNLSNFNTDNLVNASNMFYLCQSLKSLNLSNFNTSNITDMAFMFADCCCLKELDLSNFNTDKVTNMSAMFYSCGILEKLDISNFNPDKIFNTNMNFKLSSCGSLKELVLPNFKNTLEKKIKNILFGSSNKLKINIIQKQEKNKID